ncbi:MAG: Tn3 family transposase [Solirubrobacterales bacterium]
MPWRDLLSSAQRSQLLALPTARREIEEAYTLTPADRDFIAMHRTVSNRLGMAMQLCFLRHPGRAWTPEEVIPPSMLRFIADQVDASPSDLAGYARRDQTRREHFIELLNEYGWRSFGVRGYRELSAWLREQARGTDQGLALVTLLIGEIRRRRIVVPTLPVLERLTLAARARARREAYSALTVNLTPEQNRQLDGLLDARGESRQTHLSWIRQAVGAANPNNILARIERLKYLWGLGIPLEWARRIHQNRLVQIAREGAGTDVAHLRAFGIERRYATLVAAVLDTTTLLIDETLEMHERVLGRQFKKAERKHVAAFQANGKAINDKLRLYTLVGRALIGAKEAATDPFAEIEKVIPWDTFKASVDEATTLARPGEFDALALITDSYPLLRRYAPAFLEAFEFRSTPASDELVKAVALLRDLNSKNARRVPDGAPKGFIRPRWEKHVLTPDGIDRRFYEICVLSELGKALRAGDLWVSGSRRYKDFDEYLLPRAVYQAMKPQGLGIAAELDCKAYLERRTAELRAEMLHVEGLAKAGALPDASITDGVLKITPLDNQEPEEAESLNRQAYAILPRIKITDLLVEVDEWTGFTRHFTHLRSGEATKDRSLLLTAILADGINLGLTRMADACPGVSVSTLSRIATWHIREESYTKALAEIINHHHRLKFAGYWGDGTTSSSDSQRFRTGGPGDAHGQVNARYGSDPGVTFYTHVSDQYAPFHTKLISTTVRDATHVLDGLLYHESELQIEEHYTDTAGFTDHVFALCHLLGFRFAPRLRHVGDSRLFPAEKPSMYPTLQKLIGGAVSTKQIAAHWDEILRLAASIRQGTVTASLILHKLGAYPRQNALAVALRELGRLERTLFLLQYIRDAELRRRIHVGLNKGEARNALAKAVFFNRLGELRDRTHENQRHRANGLNLVVAAIVLWNTVYLELAVGALRQRGQIIPDDLLAHLSPLKWEHINLTGDYHWRRDGGLRNRKLRPLRTLSVGPRETP